MQCSTFSVPELNVGLAGITSMGVKIKTNDRNEVRDGLSRRPDADSRCYQGYCLFSGRTSAGAVDAEQHWLSGGFA